MSGTIIFVLCSIIHLVFNNTVNADVPNLVGYWKLDETFGRIAYDSSDNGNDGTLISGVYWAPKDGRFRGAANIAGHNNRGQIRIGTSGLRAAEGTIGLWALIPQAQSRIKKRSRYLFCLGISPNTIQLYFDRDDTRLDLGLGYEHRKNLSIVILKLGTWYHLAVTWARGNYAVYVDGVKRAEGNYTGLDKPPFSSSIGNNPRDGGKAFHGLVDEVAIFDGPLTEDQVAELHKEGVKFVLAEDRLQEFMQAINQSKLILSRQGPGQAVSFLEKKISEFEKACGEGTYQKRYPLNEISFDLNFALIEAKEAMGVSKKELIKAYKKLLSQPLTYSSETVSAMLWLAENTQAEDFSTFIEDCVRNATLSPRNSYHIARHLEYKRNFEVFKPFLDSIFAASNFSAYYVEAISAGIKNDEAWSLEFLDYFRDKPRLSQCLIGAYEKLVQAKAEQGQFLQSANLCREIADNCAVLQDRANYEFRSCKYLYDAGKYERADSELWRFLLRNKAVNKQLTTEAIILKSLCNIQLGSLDHALDELLTAVMEYPELDKLPQIYHLVGYCYLLRADTRKAAEVFGFLARQYPTNFYGISSRIFLKQIETCDD